MPPPNPSLDRRFRVGKPTGVQRVCVVRHNATLDVQVGHVFGSDAVVEADDHAVNDRHVFAQSWSQDADSAGLSPIKHHAR